MFQLGQLPEQDPRRSKKHLMGWFNWIQTRRGVIWLGDYPSFKSSGSTVWNPKSEHVEGWFDLGTTQASNRVVQRFGILNPNTSRGDLTWGLPKLQIEWFNGLESWIRTRRGLIWLGDYPSFKSSGSTVWNRESEHVEGWFDLGTTQASNSSRKRVF